MEQGSTLQPMEETTVEQVDLHRWRLRPVEDPPPEQILGQTCSPWRGDHAGAGDLAGAAAVGDPGWSSLLLTDGPCGTDPYLEQFLKSCCLWAAHAGSVQQGLHPVGGTPQHRLSLIHI